MTLRETAPSVSLADELAEKFTQRSATTGVVGLGYVGLPLAVELGRSGFSVIGIDNSPEKIAAVQAGECYVSDIESDLFSRLLSEGKLRASGDAAALAACDAISICVPTPLNKTKDPDLSYVQQVAEAIAEHMRPGVLIILESTTYPGTTEEVVLPVLERSGLSVGRDFFLCFSPERVDPGNERYSTRDIPKVIGGVTETCTKLGALYYSQVMEQIVPVSSTRVAEMVKLLENTFRMINIGLANEMALICDRMSIDVWEVIEAAATKPFGFMPFFPGPGLGGHCIPVDPHYLSWKIKQAGHQPRFIELAAQINGGMPKFVVQKVQLALNGVKKAVNGARIHIVGVAYKPNISDVRESPALDIIGLLRQHGAIVSFSDPFVPRLNIGEDRLESTPIDEGLDQSDCVVIVTDHSCVDHPKIASRARLVVDTRNALKGVVGDHIVRL